MLARDQDGNEDREYNGILWMREGLTRAGEPEFGQVSIYRQRACMRRRQCQVCGQKITSPVIRWLLHPSQISGGEDTVTCSPPTCDACIELSIGECPVVSRSASSRGSWSTRSGSLRPDREVRPGDPGRLSSPSGR